MAQKTGARSLLLTTGLTSTLSNTAAFTGGDTVVQEGKATSQNRLKFLSSWTFSTTPE